MGGSGSIDQLLDETFWETGELDEETRKAKDEMSAREDSLVTAGEQTQRNDLSSRLSVGDEGTRSTRTTPKKRIRIDGMESLNDLLTSELEERSRVRIKDVNLREQELDLRT